MHRKASAFALLIVLFSTGATDAKQISPQAGERFHLALKRGDLKAATLLLGPNARITENGTAESRQEYIDHHLAADAAFAKSTTRKVTAVQVTEWADQALVLTTATVTGKFRDRAIAQIVQETLILEKNEGKWVILHIHWSSRKQAN